MTPTALVSLAVFAPALLGAAGLALPRRTVGTRVALSVLAPVVSLVCLGLFVSQHGLTAGPFGAAWMSELQLDFTFNPDRLGTFFALLVAGIGLLITLYARAYFGPDPDSLYRFYPSLLLFMTAMLGLVLADNFMLLLLFWELTSISSFLLIGWERDDAAAVKKALQAFVVTGAGGLALMGGLILLGVHTGAWSLSALGDVAIRPDAVTTAAFLMIFGGAAAKSAQWPLHFWLPGAMAAPTPVSAYLHSATMVKAGVYLLGRLWPALAVLPAWPVVLVTIGAVTMVLGAYVGLRKSDLKQIFAYTTVSQLGLFVCTYGLAAFQWEGRPNLIWDVTQILNHAAYKAPLFMIAGAIGHVVHTRELPELRGLARAGGSKTVMAVILLLAAYAMASGPLTLGFAAKEFFFYGVYHAYGATRQPALLALIAAGVVTGMLQVAIFVRLARVLLASRAAVPLPHLAHHDAASEEHSLKHAADECDGTAPHGHPQHTHDAHDAPFWSAMLWLPALLVVTVQYVGGVAPWITESLVRPFEANPNHFKAIPSLAYLLTHPGVPLYMSLAGVVLGLTLGLGPVLRQTIVDPHDKLFPAFYAIATRGGGRVFGLVQTGHVRTYVGVTLCALVGVVAWATDWRSLRWPDVAIESPAALLLGFLMTGFILTTAVLMPLVRERASRILVLGTTGFAATGVYYVYRAPDLALTQISIEIVSLVLFLLVLGLLPKTAAEPRATRTLPRLAIAAAVGATMFWLTLTAAVATRPTMPYRTADGRPFAHLGDFFLRNSYHGVDTVGRHSGGGGSNVVNVILVDFRGFDTLGEITVLGIAALGVWTLLRRRSHRHHGTHALKRNVSDDRHGSLDRLPHTAGAASDAGDERSPPTGPGGGRDMSTIILRTAAKLLVPLSLIFAVFIYFKGHQTPGGGFVAGLVLAVALIVHRMSHGRASLRHLLRVRERTLIAAGLGCAAAAAAGPLLVGLPLLTSAHGYLPLPGTDGEKFAWASVLLFDLGVVLVVLGVCLGMINALTEELE
ncbi:MAG TPA: hydrogen gas-evolving membrane-bound hydrogenase subunit E [Tepidisphaeraceae bacterium]|nr:hydrogen gas-evolving membrane-bound hydrogenase subunit E [Tepidisphaeraceae bacterium]